MQQVIKCRQWTWTFEVNEGTGEVTSYRAENKGPDGKRDFFSVTSGKYGEPLMEAEPDRGFPLPNNVSWYGHLGQIIPKPDQKITGVLCFKYDDRGVLEVKQRFSLTNKDRFGGGLDAVKVEEDGSICIDGKMWYIHSLYTGDKHRLACGDVYCYEHPSPNGIRVYELAELGAVLEQQ